MVSSPSFAAHQRPDTLTDDHSMLRFPRLGAESPFPRSDVPARLGLKARALAWLFMALAL